MFDHDFYIAHFYYRTKEYWAAQTRFKTMLSDYPYGSARDKVLFYLGKTYTHLNEEVKAESAFARLLQDYPFSDYAAEAERLINVPPEEEVQYEPVENEKKKWFFFF
jgi:outer membrane protein assembly factor BamD (BamD/ComL family)